VFDWFESHSNGSRHAAPASVFRWWRSFVELHGGKVRVDSIVGKGTTVTCNFPGRSIRSSQRRGMIPLMTFRWRC